jgi:serine/threonine protein kinase
MIGKTISHYKIIEKLGEGGMGIVYKAEDSKLKRQVALKFLSPKSLSGEEEKNRFKREAQAAASLNHPNIATVFEIDEYEGDMFIAMEYIEGQNLKQMVESGPLKLKDVVRIGSQIAEGLYAAHTKDIIHRDIKSANIMITENGQVKIMDFGLAKLSNVSMLTQEGTTVGTVSYMSPEQTHGESVDYRTDIWSLGVIIYEMVSGQLPFKGQYDSAVIYSIMHEEAEPITALRTGVPMELERIVSKTMAKEAANRYQNVNEIPVDLKAIDIKSGSSTKLETSSYALRTSNQLKKEQRQWVKTIPWIIAGLMTIVAILSWLLKPAVNELPLRKYLFSIKGEKIRVNPTGSSSHVSAISPDGNMVAYIESGRLWIRDLEHLDSREISGTDGARLPIWSPQSDFIAYIDLKEQKLKKVDIFGGTISIISDYRHTHTSEGVWGPSGSIVIPGTILGSLTEVAAQGGEPRLMIQAKAEKGETYFLDPLYLSDGKTLLAILYYSDLTMKVVRIQGTKAIPIPGIPHKDISDITYSNTGHLIYTNVKGLWAVPFSVSEMKVTGQSFLIDSNGQEPSVSDDGTLVYTTSTSSDDQLVLINREGKVVGVVGQSQKRMVGPAISPDGKKVAVGGFEDGNWDIWIHDVDRGDKNRLTFHPSYDDRSTWSLSGDTVIFESGRIREGAFFKKAADFSGEAVHIATDSMFSYDPTWSQDGQYITFVTWKGRTSKVDICYIPMNSNSQGKPKLFLEGNPYVDFPTLSPDNRYLAYISNETGVNEIYVDRFPFKKGKRKVSTDGGVHPTWNRNGQELFYVAGDALVAVKVDTRSDFKMSKADTLFSATDVGVDLVSSDFYCMYDVAPDGQHFVVVKPLEETQLNIVVVQNWSEILNKKASK